MDSFEVGELDPGPNVEYLSLIEREKTVGLLGVDVEVVDARVGESFGMDDRGLYSDGGAEFKIERLADELGCGIRFPLQSYLQPDFGARGVFGEEAKPIKYRLGLGEGVCWLSPLLLGREESLEVAPELLSQVLWRIVGLHRVSASEGLLEAGKSLVILAEVDETWGYLCLLLIDQVDEDVLSVLGRALVFELGEGLPRLLVN